MAIAACCGSAAVGGCRGSATVAACYASTTATGYRYSVVVAACCSPTTAAAPRESSLAAVVVLEVARDALDKSRLIGMAASDLSTLAGARGARWVLYGPPWAHYLGGCQDRLLGGPLGLPGLRYTTPKGVEHKD
jgi:hypothetical protein